MPRRNQEVKEHSTLKLSERDMHLLSQVLSGQSASQIAASMQMSPEIVRIRLETVLRRLAEP